MKEGIELARHLAVFVRSEVINLGERNNWLIFSLKTRGTVSLLGSQATECGDQRKELTAQMLTGLGAPEVDHRFR